MPPPGTDTPRQGVRARCRPALLPRREQERGSTVWQASPGNHPSLGSQKQRTSLSTHSPNTWLLTPGAPALVPQVYRLITKNSVDQNIYNLSQRKLRMDSAVLDGITTGKGGKADETVQMGAILHSLLMGEGQAGGPAPAASGPAAADGAAPVAANGAAA